MHGSTRAVLDGNPSVTPGTIATGNSIDQVFTYDAYGKAIGFTNDQALTTLLYSGEFTNANTGNQYLRARYYDAASGRFNRLDPYFGSQTNPLSFHKYQYTHGNPISGIDPSGLITFNESLVVAGTTTALGAIVGAALAPEGQAARFAVTGAVAGLQLGVGISVAIGTGRVFSVLVDGAISLGIELVASSIEELIEGAKTSIPEYVDADVFKSIAFSGFRAFSEGVFDSSIAPKINSSAIGTFSALGLGFVTSVRGVIAAVGENNGRPLDTNQAVSTLLSTSIEATFTIALANPNLITRRAGRRLGDLLENPNFRGLILDESGQAHRELGQALAAGVSRFIGPSLSRFLEGVPPLILE